MKFVCRTVVLSVSLGRLAVAADCAAPVFDVETHPFTVSQAPDWTPDGNGFLYYKRDAIDNRPQLHTALTDGTNEQCLTCGQPGSNQFGQYSPDGQWILFHSNRGKTFTLFAPGGGGIGSELYVMPANGGDVTALTHSEEGEDNFHAYFSPDGTQIAWTHIDFALHQGGTGLWDVRLADFVVDETGPHLANVDPILPPNGHFYETQHWSPDGRGFLFTESIDNAMNLELHFLDLSTDPPTRTRYTTDPSWDEQAIFTLDGEKILFMSTRANPSSWETFAHFSWALGLPSDNDSRITGPLFLMFSLPLFTPATDLFELDPVDGSVHQITFGGRDGWILPEFTWDRAGERLLWTESRYGDRVRVGMPLDPMGEIDHILAPGTDTSDLERTARGLAAGRPAEAAERRTQIGQYVCRE